MHYIEPNLNWREQAKALFFVDHLAVSDITVIVKKARETVSRFICDCDGYDEEMAFRKECGMDRRRAYQREWDAANRKRAAGETESRYSVVTGATMRREQELAAYILSREKF